MSCLPPFEKSLVRDNQTDAVAIFVTQAKMHLREVDENQNNLKLTWGCDVMLWGLYDEYNVLDQRSIIWSMCDIQRSGGGIYEVRV